MRFSTVITVQSLKSLFELLRSFFLISLMSKPLKIWFCQFAQSAPSLSQGAPSLPKWRFAQERRAIERFRRAICPALAPVYLPWSGTVHHLSTMGPPIHSPFWRLAAEKLSATKAEFRVLLRRRYYFYVMAMLLLIQGKVRGRYSSIRGHNKTVKIHQIAQLK